MKMNQKIYKIKSDINQFLNEIKENTKLAFRYIKDDKTIDKETIEYSLLDIEETVETIESLFKELESEYENEQL